MPPIYQIRYTRDAVRLVLSSGIVLTGGSSMMQGMVELGEEIFHMPVRVGQPSYNGGLAEVVRHPRYSTAMGLLIEGMEQHRLQEITRTQTGAIQQLIDRMKAWFKGNF